MGTFTFEHHQLTVGEVHHNLPPSALYEHAIRYENDSSIAENGALVAYSGVKTAVRPGTSAWSETRSQKRRLVGPRQRLVRRGDLGVNRQRAIDYLNTRHVFMFDGFAGWDPKYRSKVRVICSRPYHALFMHNMLIRPTPQELANFGTPDFMIYNAGEFPANRRTIGMSSRTSVDLSLEGREFVILGTEYAGEMKKGIFTGELLCTEAGRALDALLRDRRQRPGRLVFVRAVGNRQDDALGGPETPADRRRRALLERPRHVQHRGRLLRESHRLSAEKEPEIFQALHFGPCWRMWYLTLVAHREFHRYVNHGEHTRSYPIEYIPNAKIPCVAGHPPTSFF